MIRQQKQANWFNMYVSVLTMSAYPTTQIRDLGKHHNVPVVVLCGRKKDVDETDTHIYDLMSVAKNEDEAMKETESCLRRLIDSHFHEFPVIKDLKGK